MITIRTKLLLYNMAIVFLLMSVTVFLAFNSNRTVTTYSTSFERFLILNEVSQLTNQSYELLNTYLTERDPVYLSEFEEYQAELITYQDQLDERIETDKNAILISNYTNMIESFLEECELTILSFKAGQIDRYSHHLSEASKVSQFIQETTLSLINSELTEYQLFFDQMNERNQANTWMVVFAVLSILFLSLILVLLFSRSVTKPISQLSEAAQEIAKGNFNIENVTIKTKDEIEMLARVFNQMRQSIQGLIHDMKEKSELDQLLKELELRTLQSQINPHFLFNTLNTISRTAYLEEAEQSVELIDSISALLRYNLGNLDKPVRLSDEVDIVKEYCFIQNTRFGDRVSIDLNIDEEALYIDLPSLTLQPLMENAFIHGIESLEEGAKLILTVKSLPSHVIIEVSDNGVGMTAETIRSIYDRAKNNQDLGQRASGRRNQGHSTGIGLVNVMRRVQLFFKEDGIIEIESEEKNGTTIRLSLPKKEKRGVVA
ncbi:sensor histidine kinase [Alkalihalobacillus hemicellulosilyticus]|uniref:histidine kinase n=1 Tax=Halalkalibacter hemicellulosilyticusJCM 9152 TaxID=1236971 RepID=W4QCC0_9BACI|nr:histidine kinase [Halalkalibacter hemicellulosilyticus]GAE29680.1 two-component sensor histidine kinase [Halalkalibacter hemicellulosilyticusJCM 9152]